MSSSVPSSRPEASPPPPPSPTDAATAAADSPIRAGRVPGSLHTLCARHDHEGDAPSEGGSGTAGRPIAPPLETSAVYDVGDLDRIDAIYEGRTRGYVYARDAHPNAERFGRKIAAIEGAEAGLALASGMAAEAAVFLATLGAGDVVAAASELYGRTARLLREELARFGVGIRSFDSTDLDSARSAIGNDARLVFVETVSNPMLRVADIEALAELARARGATLVVDHTFAPLLCRPIELGASIVTHSATKLIGGHSDLTLGALACDRESARRIATAASTFGMSASPFDCWLALRGVATLPLRVERTGATALELAERFARHPRVRAAHHPGLRSHPDHEVARRMFGDRHGAMIAIDLESRAGADAFIRKLPGIPFAPSLGDVATTLSHPSTTSHRGLPAADLARRGVHPGLVRLSIGLEDPRDLWAEFEAALRD